AKLSAHSVVERDAPTKGIEARDGATKQKLHALRREEGSREERKGLRRVRPGEEVLREIRAVVRRMQVTIDERDLAGVSEAAQLLRGAGACRARAHDRDRSRLALPYPCTAPHASRLSFLLSRDDDAAVEARNLVAHLWREGGCADRLAGA